MMPGMPQAMGPYMNPSFPGMGGGGGFSGAYGGAQNDINNYTNQGVSYLSPFQQGGQWGMNALGDMFGQFSNPQASYENFARNYQMSPGAQNQLKTGLTAVRNAMAQNGLSGSGHEAEALTNYTQGIINQDMNSQWGNILNTGRLGAGIAGTLYQGGLNAAGDMGRLYGNAGEDIAELQEAMEQQKAAQQAQNRNALWGALGTIGGGILGGPIGGAIGGKISSWL